MAGERLAHDIRRMEAAFYENHRREYELTKRISLASLDPVALIALRKTGACHFELPSVVFNLDHDSHFLRRIKLVRVSLPAITGPHTGIGVTLTYEGGKIRRTADGELVDDIAGTVQSQAISAGQDDTGLFEPNFRDERYLPFEGKGVEDSRWRLELPAAVRQFDYETIADVIVTVSYTAREGGSTTRTAIGSLADAIGAVERPGGGLHGVGQVQLLSARTEFPVAWRSFLADGDDKGDTSLELDLSEQRFPHPHLPPGGRKIEFVAVFVRWPADTAKIPNPVGEILEDVTLTPPGDTSLELAFAPHHEDNPPVAGYNYLFAGATAAELGKTLGTWSLHLPNGWPSGYAPEDIILAVGHALV